MVALGFSAAIAASGATRWHHTTVFCIQLGQHMHYIATYTWINLTSWPASKVRHHKLFRWNSSRLKTGIIRIGPATAPLSHSRARTHMRARLVAGGCVPRS
eukprot:COSAG02_NODE_5643_length_4159_cov_7.496798_2_plen_101_part_00